MTDAPKNFALQLGALISLYCSIAALTVLLFAIITILLPDAADRGYVVERATNTIRFSTAALIVIFPAYLWLTRTMNQIRRREEGAYLTITKWLIYLSLVVGGAILLGDLVAVIYNYLSGELTTRFLLKAAILAIITALAFYYYLKDAQNYWQAHEKQSKQFALGAFIIVLAALVLGFMNSETPQEVREVRIDDNQIRDLQQISSRVEVYYHANETLPTNIAKAYQGLVVPIAPEDRRGYEYRLIDDTTYELCAEFAQDSASSEHTQVRPYPTFEEDWIHGEGDWCFKRTVNKPQNIE